VAVIRKTYAPRGAARELLTSTLPEICIAGPAGTGKSLAALFKVHFSCLQVPYVQALIVRQTHISLTSTTLNLFERVVIREAKAAGIVKWFGGSGREPPAYRYNNGSTIIVGGLDKPEKFLSAELDLVFVDEATEITKDAMETLISRLRGNALRHKQIILGCNPSHPQHWIKLRCESGPTRMLFSHHVDNPVYFDGNGAKTEAGEAYMSKLDALTGVRRLRLRDGIWAAAEGVIYEDFDESVHVIEPFEVPESWTRWWSVDFGYVNPFVWQLWAMDPDGILYLVHEIYRTRQLVEDHAKDILEVVQEEPTPRAVICDHDAEGRATLEKGIRHSTIAAHKAVLEGIQAVQARLVQRRLFIMRGALVRRDPDLVDAKRPTSTVEEIPGYVWATKRGGIDGQIEKDEPLKENDHGCDAMRYVVSQLDLRGRPRIRSMGFPSPAESIKAKTERLLPDIEKKR
jgi:PBSX family phage terminase large subunit